MGCCCRTDQYLGVIMKDGTHTPPDNSRVRTAMAAYVADPTVEQGEALLLTMVVEKFTVLVPMALEPDGSWSFTTSVMAEPNPVLHVYTSVDELPPLESDVEVRLYPYVDLIMDLLEGEERWNGLVIDPKAAHSVSEYFPPTGGHTFYSTAALRDAVPGPDPALN